MNDGGWSIVGIVASDDDLAGCLALAVEIVAKLHDHQPAWQADLSR